MKSTLRDKIKKLPLSPGVYLYKNAAGEIIYIGKAVKLRHRVQQYFRGSGLDRKTKALVREVVDFDHITVDSELDALILEAELVKRHQPRYNVLLRDDKSNIFIKITDYKTVPDVSLVRLPNDEQATYFGPFYNTSAIRQALRYLRRIFPYFIKPYNPTSRPSLDRHIGLDPAVETAEGREKYRQNVHQIIRFLSGERLKIIAELEESMQQAALNQEYELAANYRNQIRQLRALQQKVRISNEDGPSSQLDPGLSQLQRIFGLKSALGRIEGFDVSHFAGSNVVGSMAVFTNGLPDRPAYRKFKLKIDQNDDFYSMREIIKRRFQPTRLRQWSMPNLVIIDGGKGQLVSAIQSLKEVDQLQLPVIGLAERLDEIIIASDSNIQLRRKQLPSGYRLHYESTYQILLLPRNAPALQLLQRVRNEAHRFALNYQSQRRRRYQLESRLDEIKGVGPKTRQKLQRALPSQSSILTISETDLAAVVGQHKARLIYQALHQEGDKTRQTRYNKFSN